MDSNACPETENDSGSARFIERTALLLVAVAGFFAAVSVWLDLSWYILGGTLFGVAGLGSAFVVSRLGYPFHATSLLLLSANLTVLFCSAEAGRESQAHLVLLALAPFPLMLFAGRHRALITLWTVVPVVLFFWLKAMDWRPFLGNPSPVPEMIGWMTPAASFVILILAGIYFLEFKARTEASLRESEQKLNSVLDSIKDMVFSLSLSDYRLTYVNPAVLEMHGRSRSELQVGLEHWVEFIHPDDRESTLGALERVVNEGAAEAEYRIIRSDGEIRWAQTRMWKAFGPGGDAEARGVSRDVTEAKENEWIIAEQNRRIEASKRLVALGEMAAGIAHEINNPLAIVIGRLDLMMDSLESGGFELDDLAEKITQVRATAMRISKIIRTMKSFSRDHSTETFQQVSLRGVIEETAGLLSDQLAVHGVELRVAPFESAFEIECLPLQLSQVFMNLISNASDAVSRLTEKWIEISVRDAGDQVEIRVRDSGSGIPEDVRDKLFHPFFTTKEVGLGTGIGLSFSSGVILKHQGTLELDPRDPRTTFLIVLPKARAEARPEPAAGHAYC